MLYPRREPSEKCTSSEFMFPMTHRRPTTHWQMPRTVVLPVLVILGLIATRIEAFAPRVPFQTSPTTNVFSEVLQSTNYNRRKIDRPTHSSRPTTSRRYSDSTLDQPPLSNFEHRMRKLANPMHKKNHESSTASKLSRNVQEVHTLQDYKRVVMDESDKLVVVRFYAPWCKACRAVAPLFYRMARDNPNVKFVEVPVSEESAAIHQGLGVPSLPFLHIYHPEAGLVEELRMTRKHAPMVLGKLRSYMDGSCEVAEEEGCSNPYSIEAAGTDYPLRP